MPTQNDRSVVGLGLYPLNQRELLGRSHLGVFAVDLQVGGNDGFDLLSELSRKNG